MIKALFFAPQALAYGPDEPDLLAGILQAEGIAASRDQVAEALAKLPADVQAAGRAVRTPEEERAFHRTLWAALLPLLGRDEPDPAVLRRLGAARDDYPAWWSLYAETLPVLAELRRRGYLMGAVGRWAPSLARFLAEFELEGDSSTSSAPRPRPVCPGRTRRCCGTPWPRWTARRARRSTARRLCATTCPRAGGRPHAGVGEPHGHLHGA